MEGPNRCGKTTFAKMLQAAGFKYIKSTRIVSAKDSIVRMQGMLDMLIELDKQGVNCVVDRFHLTDAVYGLLSRGQTVDISGIDAECAEHGFVLMYMVSTFGKMNERGYTGKTDVDMSRLVACYEDHYERSKMNKYIMAYGGEDK
jgi:hypothetical protein